MEGNDSNTVSLDQRIAHRLKALRSERGWSLDALAKLSGVSRATLSRLENAEVSPTASVLGKLASTFGLSISRLMAMAETDYSPLIPRADQQRWVDPETGFVRVSVSPPAKMLGAELLECMIPPGQSIVYENSPHAGLEHHLYMLDGHLELTVDGATYRLNGGDCVRYQLYGESEFETCSDLAAHYLLVVL